MNLYFSIFKYFLISSILVLLLSNSIHAMQPRAGGFVGLNQHSNSFGALGDVDRTARQLRWLDISDDQRQQIWNIADGYRNGLREQRDTLSDGYAAIQEIMISESYDPVQLSALADNQGNTVARMIEQHAQMVREMAAVLTAEQAAMLLELIQSGPVKSSQNGRFNTSDSAIQ